MTVSGLDRQRIDLRRLLAGPPLAAAIAQRIDLRHLLAAPPLAAAIAIRLFGVTP